MVFIYKSFKSLLFFYLSLTWCVFISNNCSAQKDSIQIRYREKGVANSTTLLTFLNAPDKHYNLSLSETVRMSPSGNMAITYDYDDTHRKGFIKLFDSKGNIIYHLQNDSAGGDIYLSNDGRFVVWRAIEISGFLITKSKLFFYSSKGKLLKYSNTTFSRKGAGIFTKDGHFVFLGSTSVCFDSCPTFLNVYDINFNLIGNKDMGDFTNRNISVPHIDDLSKQIQILTMENDKKGTKITLVYDFKANPIKKIEGWKK